MHIKNKRRLALSALTTLIVVAATATAYYLFFEPGKGATVEGSPIGSPTSDGKELNLKPEEKLALAKPGTSVAIHLWVTSESASGQQIKKLAFTPTVDATHLAAGCSASWFTVTGTGTAGEALTAGGAATPLPVKANAAGEEIVGPGKAANGTLSYTFKEEAATNQNACAGAEVKWAVTSTG
jgi:hypothetical protein